MNNYPHIKVKCGLNSLGTLEDLNLMGVCVREKGTREREKDGEGDPRLYKG